MKDVLVIAWIMWATIGLGYVGLSYALLWERIREDRPAGRPSIFESPSKAVVFASVVFSILVGVVFGPLSIFIWRLNFRPYD